ncbi:MAG: hypothetical protein RJR34_11705 [Candidatus Methanoculleus thermohydrogenotrophicum]|nr:hypothetical protein [Candidatus Methanoculleus thermohydrogenotrophicum]
MNQKEGLLLLGVIITLFCVPAAVTAAGSGSYDPYITVTLESPKEYLNLKIEMIDALDPLDVGTTSVTLKSSETRDLKAIEGPLLGDITRKFRPSSGNYHGAEVTVIGEKTIDGKTIPCDQHVYITPTIPSFTVKVPGRSGNVILAKCPENVDPEANFTDIFNAAEKEGYLFIKNGVAHYDGEGNLAFVGNVRANANDLNYTLNENKVGLTDFTFSTKSVVAQYPDIYDTIEKPKPGEYLLAAVEYDSSSNTMHVLAAMPVLILDGDTPVTWSGGNPYCQNGEEVTICFDSGVAVDKIAYALVKKDARYGLEVEVDTSELAKQPIPTSPVDAVSILKGIVNEGIPARYTLTCCDVEKEVTYNTDTCLAIVKGYGCSGGANGADKVKVAASTLKELNPGTYYLYALGMKGQKVVAVDQTCIAIAFPISDKISDDGYVTDPIEISAGTASLHIQKGVKAVDKEGKPLPWVSIASISSADLPPVPAGARFAPVEGYAYDLKPDGATFEPEITLTLSIEEEDWSTLDLENNDLKVKWYDEDTRQWEDVPTTVSESTKRVNATIAHFSIFALFSEEKTTEPTPTPYIPGRSGGGGGGGGGSSYTSYTETGTLKVGNTGTVLRSIKVKAEDGIGSLFVPIGTTALDADGNPLSEVSITAIGRADLPDVPYGAAYTFAGYAYETSPDGATFEPEITLSLEFPDADWNALDPDNNNFIVKWYNEETYQWEDVPTTVFQSTKSVDAKITHFSTFALFSEPVTTPIDTSPTTPTTPSTPPADEAPPTEGLSMTMIIVILIIIIIVIAAGYYFLVRK